MTTSTESRYLTPDRLALQAEARRFAIEEVLPVANECDPVKAEFPDEFIAKLAAQGYFGITIDTEHGGMGLGVFEYCMISEELARAWMSSASIIGRGNGMGCGVSDPDRQNELLRLSAAGQWIGAAALSEPGAGSDLAAVSTRAVRDGDEWVITGEKRWCGNAKRGHFIQLLARTRDPEPGESRSRGLSTFLIEKEPGTFPDGLTGVEIDKIGYHGFLTFNLTFDGLRVPADALMGRSKSAPEADADAGTKTKGMVGGKDQAFAATQRGLNVARVHTAARAVGLARGALEDCIAYVQEREQFGRPIGDFQAIRFMIADMAAQIEASRQLYYYAAQLIDDGSSAERESAMAKYQCSEMATVVTGNGIQIHGGNGYTTERQVERHWRDARLTTIFEGTSQIQQKIISDRLLPRSPLG